LPSTVILAKGSGVAPDIEVRPAKIKGHGAIDAASRRACMSGNGLTGACIALIQF
jgi:hypothetical protein